MTITCIDAGKSNNLLKKGEKYSVACLVSEGKDYSGAVVKDAYILCPNKDHQFLYCWDRGKFEIYEHCGLVTKVGHP